MRVQVLGIGVCCCSTLVCGCVSAPDPEARIGECPSTDARICQTAPLRTYFHGVSGTARIVDNCTIVIGNFTYDGGLDVRVYGGKDPSFQDAVILSSDLHRPDGYRDETLTVKLPQGVTLDDVRATAIWCIVVNADFGDGMFQ